MPVWCCHHGNDFTLFREIHRACLGELLAGCNYVCDLKIKVTFIFKTNNTILWGLTAILSGLSKSFGPEQAEAQGLGFLFLPTCFHCIILKVLILTYYIPIANVCGPDLQTVKHDTVHPVVLYDSRYHKQWMNCTLIRFVRSWPAHHLIMTMHSVAQTIVYYKYIYCYCYSYKEWHHCYSDIFKVLNTGLLVIKELRSNYTHMLRLHKVEIWESL